MKSTPNYPLGNMAITLASARYLAELKKVAKEAEESGKTGLNELLASTYLRGLYDMACLYQGVVLGDDLAEHLTRIDLRVMNYEKGGYEGEPDDEPEVEPDA